MMHMKSPQKIRDREIAFGSSSEIFNNERRFGCKESIHPILGQIPIIKIVLEQFILGIINNLVSFHSLPCCCSWPTIDGIWFAACNVICYIQNAMNEVITLLSEIVRRLTRVVGWFVVSHPRKSSVSTIVLLCYIQSE